MSFLSLDIYFIAISFLASLSAYVYSKKSSLYLKLFPPFLLATCLAESWGAYLVSIKKQNVLLYNFFSTFEFCFYYWVISLIVRNRRVKRNIRITSILYAITATVNIVFIQKMKAFHTVTYALGCLVVVLFCIYYFFELFRLPKSVRLVNDPAFWICSGLLFFYCCGFPLYAFMNYWMGVPIIVDNFTNIFAILNIFLYSLFTIAFLCIKPRKYTLSSS